MSNRWYRAYEGTITDAKLAEVKLVAQVSKSVVIATWHAVLESCAVTQDKGRFETTPRRVAAALDEPMDAIHRVFEAFIELGLIAGDVVCAWPKRQFESDNSTERSRKHREASRNADATLQQQYATPPYTETETDTEPKKKEKEPRADALASDFPKDAFKQWYAVYPKKEDPKAAERSFAKVQKSGEVTFERLMQATDRYAVLMKSTERKWWKMPATWLNRGCWANEDLWPEAKAAPSQVPLGMVHVKRDSAEWDRYAERHRRERGKDPPTDSQGGWTFAVIEPERADCAA